MKWLNSFFRRIFRLNLEKSSSPIYRFLFCLVLLLPMVGLFKVTLNLDISKVDDPTFQSVVDFKNFKKKFGEPDGINFYILKKDGKPFSHFDLCQIRKWTQSLEGKILATSILNLRYPKYEKGELWYYLYSRELDCADKINTPSMLKNKLWENYFYSKGAKDIVIQFNLSESSNQNRSIGELEAKFKDTLGKEYVYHIHGPAGIKYYFQKILIEDNYINIVILAFIFVFFYAFFGTVKVGLTAAVTLFASTLITVGLMGLTGVGINIINNSLFVILALAAVQDVIFVFADYNHNELTLADTLEKFITPCFFTSFTTIVGFLTMYLSPMEYIREFGVVAAIAVFLEWLILFFVFPMFIKGNWKKHRKYSQALVDVLDKKPTRYTVVVATLLFVISFFYIPKLRIEERPMENFPYKYPLSKSMRYVKETRNWESQVFLTYDLTTDMSSIVAGIKKINGVSDILSLDGIRTTMSEGYPDFIKERINSDFYQLDFTKSFIKNDQGMMIILLSSYDLTFLEKMNRKIGQVCAKKCVVTGQPIVYQDFNWKMIKDLEGALLVCALLVAFIVGVLYWVNGERNFPKVFFSMFWGPVVLLGLVAFFDYPLQLINSLAITILLGLAGDNAIHYVFAKEMGEELTEGVSKRTLSSFYMTVFLLCASLSFLLMRFMPMKTIGVTLFIGFLLSFLGDYFLIKKTS